jgi:gas vesicle protein
MFERKKTNYWGFTFTFLAGALAGGAIALLYTPVTGKKMQKKVGDIAEKVIDKVDDIRKFAKA